MSGEAHNAQVRDQFTQQAQSYGDLVKSLGGDRTAPLRAFAKITAEDDVLEVACGTGSLTMQLAPFVRRVTGIDLTPAMLERGKAEQEARAVGNIEWLVGDVGTLPFADKRFSLVICQAAFHHFEQPAAAFAEMVRVCRPGGRITVVDVTPAAGKVILYDQLEQARDPSHAHALPLGELCAIGQGLPVGTPEAMTSVRADMPFDSVLATSFPDPPHTRESIAALMHDDAVSGEDRYGFAARLIDGRVCVSYPMSTVVWTKFPAGEIA